MNLQVFNCEGSTVRVVEKDGEPWFVAADVCSYFSIVNSRNVAARLDEDEKGVCDVDTNMGKRQTTIINESGLYHLLFTLTPSNARGIDDEEIERRNEKLKNFKRWVTHDVLPSIRKHGLYAVDEVLENPDILIRALTALKEERAKLREEREKTKELELQSAIQMQQIAEMRPKVSYYDVVLSCPDLVQIKKIAKDYGWSAQKLNKILAEKGVQYKQSGQWLLYQKYSNKGYTQSRTYLYGDEEKHSRLHTLWTQAGRLFIYDLLKADGVLPVCERGEG